MGRDLTPLRNTNANETRASHHNDNDSDDSSSSSSESKEDDEDDMDIVSQNDTGISTAEMNDLCKRRWPLDDEVESANDSYVEEAAPLPMSRREGDKTLTQLDTTFRHMAESIADPGENSIEPSIEPCCTCGDLRWVSERSAGISVSKLAVPDSGATSHIAKSLDDFIRYRISHSHCNDGRRF